MSTWAIFPSEEDIIHKSHKYLERKRGKNGKWQYIYKRAKNKVKKAVGLEQKEKLELSGKGLQNNINRLKNANINNVQSLYEATKDAKDIFLNNKSEFENTFLGKINNVKEKGLQAFDKLFGTNFSKNSLSNIDLSQINKNFLPQDILYDKYLEDKPLYSKNLNQTILYNKDQNGNVINPTGLTNKKNSSSTKSATSTKKSSGTAYTPSYTTKSDRSKVTSFTKKASASTGSQRGGLVGNSFGRINDPQSSTAYQKSRGAGRIGNSGTGVTLGRITGGTTKKKKRRKA